MAFMKKNTNSSSWTIPSFTLMTNALRIMTAVRQRKDAGIAKQPTSVAGPKALKSYNDAADNSARAQSKRIRGGERYDANEIELHFRSFACFELQSEPTFGLF